MKKFEAAVLDVLAVGDRFYFTDDRKKRVYQLIGHGRLSAEIVQIGTGVRKSKSYGRGTMKPVHVVFLTSESERKEMELDR